MNLDLSARSVPTQEHALFRDSVRKVLDRVMAPFLDLHEEHGIVPREVWREMGTAGMLCPTVAEQYGGLGLDFSYNAIVTEEVSYLGSSAGFSLQSDVVVEYIERYGSEELKQRYLPGMINGSLIAAIAMTEPGTGSDLQGIRTTAIRDLQGYRINGSKTYITNGINADLIIVVAKTNPREGSKGISLLVVDAASEGFRRGRKLDKIGQRSSDTAELFFEDVVVPAGNLLGDEGRGFGYLMNHLPQERLTIAISAQAIAQRAFDEATAFAKDRTAFGQRIFDFQNTRFTLADLATQLQVGWAHLDWALARHVRGELTATQASAAKLWHTEMQSRVVDTALQLHGGAGYMNEYPIARIWRDSRVSRIFGGTSEIMKEVIGRSL